MANDWESIGRELIQMMEQDLRVRSDLAADGSLFQGYHPRMRAVHDANARRLAAILDSCGWPGGPQVGKEAAEAAWLIAQHAIAQPELQRQVLKLLKAGARQGDVPPDQVARLEDRILILEGRPQLYGTQFDWDSEGRMSPLPIEDPENVDQRRRAVGLGPLEHDVRRQREAMVQGSERPPEDCQARRQEMEEWCRQVGWRT